ncbi:hypothetical protein MMC07_007231 [Pseudocyphellaria aurata]|nr:hypothetical protein [Pseudocyphellaria aurata]
MRFKAPSYPESIENPLAVQDSTYGPSCPQIDVSQPCRPNGTQRVSPQKVALSPGSEESEDCLFLDIYVPSSAFESGGPPLPVVVWIYGGGYTTGAKNVNGASGLLYNGTGLLQAAAVADQGKVIFIAGNYRLGAFGWLAGLQMEEGATPNAGLYDQRLLLQWVQDFVHLIGGDKSKVSVWGESAGGGSIVHHLISQDGQQDPLFSKAVIQSPGYQWKYDRAGMLDDTYRTFSSLAGCPDHSIECLQHASTSALITANQQLFEQTLPCTGVFPLGPALDGKLIKELPAVAFDRGNYWKGLESIIVSHTYDEGGIFASRYLPDSTSKAYVKTIFPQLELWELREYILEQYPADAYPNDTDRAAAIIGDMVLTCNTRFLYDAYHQEAETYMMQYSVGHDFGVAIHGSDIMALFWNSWFDIIPFLQVALSPYGLDTHAERLGDILGVVSPRYQSYFASHAIHGNPNTGKLKNTPQWHPAKHDAQNIYQTMQVTGNLSHIFENDFTDVSNTKDVCDFWKETAWEITVHDEPGCFSGRSDSPEVAMLRALVADLEGP